MESRFDNNEINMGIDALLHPRCQHRSDDLIHGIVGPTQQLNLSDEDELASPTVPSRRDFYDLRKGRKFGRNQVDSERKQDKKKSEKVVTVTGREIGDLPCEYQVRGLRKNEYPVIGTFVHQNIVPGFKYLVRQLGTDQYLFNKEPKTLTRIGQGYGKRITFESELKNSNNNYFYSDTRPQGYGFSIVAISEGDSFTVVDEDDCPVGEGVITKVGPQREISSRLQKNGRLVKMVAVNFCCDVQYGSNKHGLMPLFHEYTMELNATAVVVKKAKQRSAKTQSIEQLELPLLGACTLQLSD